MSCSDGLGEIFSREGNIGTFRQGTGKILCEIFIQFLSTVLKKISLNWNQCRLAIRAITELAVLGRDEKNMTSSV